jgi:hypothetical protein
MKPPSDGSRDVEFFTRLAERIISNESVIAKYKYILKKVNRLNVEFVKGSWPDYERDVETLHDVTRYILSLEKDLTPSEVSKVYEILRSSLGYAGARMDPAPGR